MDGYREIMEKLMEENPELAESERQENLQSALNAFGILSEQSASEPEQAFDEPETSAAEAEPSVDEAEEADRLPPAPATAVLPEEPAEAMKPRLAREERLQRREARRREHRRKQILAFGGLAAVLVLLVLALVLILHSCDAKAPAQQGQTQEQTGQDAFIGPIKPAPEINWEAYTMSDSDQTGGSLVLVNAKQTWTFPENDDLVSLYERKTSAYSLTGADLLLDEQAMEPLNQMMDAFRTATGHSDLLVTAAYRSFEQQQKRYQESVEKYGEGSAAEYAAKPGETELHTGLAVDFQTCLNGVYDSLHNEGDYAWLFEHCAEFGFVDRYPESKSGITGVEGRERSFRYVGKPHAEYMKENGLCLEEYIELVRRHPWDGEHLTFGIFEIYFCTGRTVYVQEGWQYAASGINGDGFVVVSWQN